MVYSSNLTPTTPAAFAGRTILVTGAASGIGEACAIRLAQSGARLALVDIDAVGLELTARAVAAVGGTAFRIVADLARAEEVDAVAQQALEQLGHIDVLFSNAGVAVVKPLTVTTDEDWQWIFDINVRAPIRLTRAIVPHMVARGQGQVVLTASLAGLVGAPGMVAYSTTKFALVGFAEALRPELAEAGIGVTVICPGMVRTNLHRATRYLNDGFARFLDAPPSWYGVSKERAAQIILEGIARRRPQVVFGSEKVGWWLKRLWPAASFAMTRWLARRLNILAPPTVAPEDRACTSR